MLRSLKILEVSIGDLGENLSKIFEDLDDDPHKDPHEDPRRYLKDFHQLGLLNAKPVFSDSSGLNGVFEWFHFLDGLVWMVGLSMEIKLRLQISPV